MRQIFLDTETTGLYHAQGHRVIEIAAVEVVNRRLTKQHFHYYLNPDREIDQGAQEVHGISLEFLQDKPRFPDIVNELLDFIADAELIMHNAPFDVGFLNCELGLIEQKPLESIVAKVTDTLKIAKEMRPGQRNSLDALCRHFGIDNSKRTLHGALLDAELLADPFMIVREGVYYLFFEILLRGENKGVIGHAVSADGFDWQYRGVVMKEEFHLAYPHVFEWNGQVYMVPESHDDFSVRLYRAVEFPQRWEFVNKLLTGHDYVDATLFRHADMWWMFASTTRNDVLNLYYSKITVNYFV